MAPVAVIAAKLRDGVNWERLPFVTAKTIIETLDAAGYKIVRKDETEQMLERVKRIKA